MRILFNDIIQYSDLQNELKSPALSDITYIEYPLIINLDKPRNINSIGIGNVDNKDFNVIFNDVNNTEFNFTYTNNGLYVMRNTVLCDKIIINSSASYIGRIGAGIGCNIPTAIPKEPTFNSTNENRNTLSGQVIAGIGGYNFISVSLDSRYKIDEYIMNEIKNGTVTIGKGFPFFIDLTVESYKLPFNKLYAIDRNQFQFSFESGVKKYLYSRRFIFEEKF